MALALAFLIIPATIRTSISWWTTFRNGWVYREIDVETADLEKGRQLRRPYFSVFIVFKYST
jgi:hypothetical protein